MVKSNYVTLENYEHTQIFSEKWDPKKINTGKGNNGDPCTSNSDCITVQGLQCSNGTCRYDVNLIRSRHGR